MILIFVFATLIILISALVFASRASTALPSDDDLAKAKSDLVWVSTVGWISVIVIFFFGIFFAFETAASGGMTSIFMVAILGLLGFTGWLSASATTQIKDSSEYMSNTDKTAAINTAYNDAWLATALSLGSLIFLIVVVVVYYVGRSSVKKGRKRRKERREEVRVEE